jgi:sialic acid synthase SpsE
MMNLIAEVGWNHMGDMDLASQMIHAAKEAGADYVKFQTWKVKRLTAGPWDDDGRREIYNKAELSDQDHHFLKEKCDEEGVNFLTSCFCQEDLEFIRSISSAVKIPSTECRNRTLVEEAIERFEKVFISTGASKYTEYQRWAMFDNVWLLHCVSSYPCPADYVNLPKMKSLFALTKRVGYSGHYEGIWDAIAAISYGATVVEKHFTTDKSLPGRDNKFAILPEEFHRIREYADIFAEMSVDRGLDYQECEDEQRERYARRWG